MCNKYLTIIAVFLFTSLSCQVYSANSTLEQMCQRLFPKQAKAFVFQLTNNETDFFTLESTNGKIIVSANNNNSLAVGVNHYLKYYCHTNISWYATDQIEMPETLPMLSKKIEIRSKCNNRFFLNYCTFGYTMPYWKWNDWERLIDWMALNGVTMPLAISGQESVWYKVWSKMGLKDAQIRSYFTGPAHLPWHRMSNVDYWQSPLPKSWLQQQEQLQKQILKREREFNMTPVLPAFTGHVPAELKEIYPKAKIYQMSKWGGYDEKYRSHFIPPMDSLFNVIQTLYLKEQTELYGTDHVYGIDPFNEVDSPDWSESFLSNVSSKIYDSIHQVDSLAQWVQMTWMFYHSKEKWTQPRIKSFLNAVPDNKLILLDYYCDFTEIWKETNKFYGKPYIWCYLGNFGGNSMLVGNIGDVSTKIANLFANGGDNVYGLGATLEGFDVNPLMYEFVLEKAWNYTISDTDWVSNWAMCRGGNQDVHILKAWEMLHEQIYTKHTVCGQSVLINARPKLVGIDSWNTHPEIHYDNAILWNIWEEFLQAKNVSRHEYKVDVVNVGRQVLGNLFSTFRDSFTSCYNKKDIKGMKQWATLMDALLLDTDRLLSCETTFSLGKWIGDAKDFGNTTQEKDYYEENARCILTVWGQKATQLNDYANRGWGGLTKTFYRERWNRFTAGAILAVENGKEFDEKEYYQDITDFEYQWTKQKERYNTASGEDATKVAKILFNKYRSYFKKTNL
ncbi:MAG: alpha-N-acetylglucosaminidase [Muribaculaceae bacterium]